MNIAHISTRFGAGGASGGPVSVAINLSKALTEVDPNNQVTLYTGWDGKADAPAGVDTRLYKVWHLRATNFTVVRNVRLFIDLWRSAKSIDVAHVHLARDFVSAPAALILMKRSVPVVVQTHGMLNADSRLIARVLDRFLMKPVLNRCKTHLVLTATEERSAASISGSDAKIKRLVNGISPTDFRSHWPSLEKPEVLFCARLHERKRVHTFVDMAELLIESGIDAQFTILGPDEGDLASLQKRLALRQNKMITYEGSAEPSKVLERISRAHVFVLPSVDEPFPVTVLEAMSAGVPSVITDSNGIAPILRKQLPDSVSGQSAEELANAVRPLLTDPAKWSDIATRSRSIAESQFSQQAVAETLQNIYHAALTS